MLLNTRPLDQTARVPRVRTPRTQEPPGFARNALTAGVAILFLAIASLEFEAVRERVQMSYIRIPGVILIVAAALGAGWRRGVRIRRCRDWLTAAFVGTALALLHGILRGNPPRLLASELITVLVFWSGILFATSEDRWRLIARAYVISTGLIAIPVVLIGLLTAGTTEFLELRDVPLYRTSILLVPATFLVLLPRKIRPRWSGVVIWFGFVLYAAVQTILAKRAPSARVLLIAFAATVLVPYLSGMKTRAARRIALWGAATAIGVALCLVVGPPQSVRRAMSIVSSLGQFEEYRSTGVIEKERINDVFRFHEAMLLPENMSAMQVCVGTGIGGYITDSRLAAVETVPGLPGARSSAHMGLLWFFIKGGLALSLCYYGLFFALLADVKSYRRDRLWIASWTFLAVMVLFQVIEGHWMLSTMDATAFLVGGCVGALCTAPRRADESSVYRRIPVPQRFRCRQSN